jgi:hypothetical protein
VFAGSLAILFPLFGTSRIGGSGVCGFVASVLGHPRDPMSSVGSWRDLVDLACAAGRGFFVPAKATPFPIRRTSAGLLPIQFGD